jgi:hypothetical protein
MAENNKPVKKFRVGGVAATVWQNTFDKIVTKSVTLDRSYKDDKGEWKSTGSLHANDIPKAVLALQKAYDFCFSSEKDEEQ